MEEKKKVTIVIADNEFTVTTGEGEEYTKALAKSIDDDIAKLTKSSTRISVTAAAILTALNYADINKKLQQEENALSQRLEGYLADMAEIRSENDRLRADKARLEEQIAALRFRLAQESRTINEEFPISPAVRHSQRQVADSDTEEAAEETVESEQAFFDSLTHNNVF